jgi:hypothetical protein
VRATAMPVVSVAIAGTPVAAILQETCEAAMLVEVMLDEVMLDEVTAVVWPVIFAVSERVVVKVMTVVKAMVGAVEATRRRVAAIRWVQDETDDVQKCHANLRHLSVGWHASLLSDFARAQ